MSWTKITDHFNQWAIANGRPQRDAESLRNKWNRLLKGPPTGHGGPSERQLRARAVEELCVQDVGGAVLDDAEKSENSSSEADLNAVIAEADGISVKRASDSPPFFHFCLSLVPLHSDFYPHLCLLLETAKRGKQALRGLSSLINLDADDQDSSSRS